MGDCWKDGPRGQFMRVYPIEEKMRGVPCNGTVLDAGKMASKTDQV